MSLSDGGLVIDVRAMNQVAVDAKARRAVTGAGATWGEFDRATQEHGLATTGGRASTTGVAGFTLGGGSGWIERKHGLACDNLVGVTLVTADGDVVRADEDQNPDLLWASRGGGGNFGVVTELELRLHDLGPIVTAGLMIWDGGRGDEIVHAYRDIADAAPEELGTGAVFLTGPPEEFVPEHLQGQLCVGVAACYAGSVDDGAKAVEPLKALQPDVDLVGPMPYADFQCMTDVPPGFRNYWGAEYMSELNDDALRVFVKYSNEMRSPMAQNILLPWGGEVARVSADDTPMAQRDAAWITHPFVTWEDPADDESNIAWGRQFLADMRDFTSGGVYLNFIGDEGADRVRAAFGSCYDRLVEVKRRYDPDNVFHRNQNIRP
jgi:FAD/FMN-containing dehydrogenase